MALDVRSQDKVHFLFIARAGGYSAHRLNKHGIRRLRVGRSIQTWYVSLTFMATDHLLALLIKERDKLTAAIEALQGPTTTEKTPGPGRKAVLPSVEQNSKPEGNVALRPAAKRKMSAAGRRAIIAGTNKRWAAINVAKAALGARDPVTAAPKAAPAKVPVALRKGGLTTAGRKALSIAMKKGWAAKKKAAAKGKAS